VFYISSFLMKCGKAVSPICASYSNPLYEKACRSSAHVILFSRIKRVIAPRQVLDHTACTFSSFPFRM